MNISVQQEDFDPGAEIEQLRQANVGAIASFVGVVRDTGGDAAVSGMTLEHYPGMTEKALAGIVAEAEARWPLVGVRLIHRIGRLAPADRIVLVAVSSAHRAAAFAACEFIMDRLKTDAPFWKMETTPEGERWVAAKDSDRQAAERWC
jgi:molybdopterin synthase catalytic subunit